MMNKRPQLGSTAIDDDQIIDSSGLKRVRAICNGCNADRGYVRRFVLKKMCQSCGQKGKISPRLGASLSKVTKAKISLANNNRNLQRNPQYVKPSLMQKKLIHSLRSRVSQFVAKKNQKTQELLGCSWSDFCKYIESQFTEGMNWNNYGRKGWQLDHKIPLSSFDLSVPEQLAKASHFSNLQPLWWKDNLLKSNKVLP